MFTEVQWRQCLDRLVLLFKDEGSQNPAWISQWALTNRHAINNPAQVISDHVLEQVPLGFSF
jgi:hypothetical protein